MKIENRKEFKIVISNKSNQNYLFNIRKDSNILYPSRSVSSLYMDTIDFKIYQDSLFNDTNKFKIRFRQYNNRGKINKEIKYNSINGRYKTIESTNFNSFDEIEMINYKKYSLIPITYVSFNREYYFYKNARITVDTDLRGKLCSFVDLNESEYLSDKTIIEYKLNSTKNFRNNLLNKIAIDDKLSIEDLIIGEPTSFSKYTYLMDKLMSKNE